MGNAYIGMEPQNPFYQEVRTKYVASNGQTLFTGLTYKPGYIDVYVNGSKLVEGVDFTALNGNSVTLATALNDNDDVEIQTRVPTQIADVLNHETGIPRAELASNAGAELVGYQVPGGVVRDVAGKLGEVVSVKDFDTIQAAVDSSVGGYGKQVIAIPVGDIPLSNGGSGYAVNLPSDISLTGVGGKLSASAMGFSLLRAEGEQNISIVNTKIQATGHSGNDSGSAAIRLEQGNNDTHNYEVMFNSIVDTSWGALLTAEVGTGTAHNIRYIGNEVRSSTPNTMADGLHVVGKVTNTAIVANTILNRGDAGIALNMIASHNGKGFCVTGNACTDNLVGVDISGGSYGVVSGNACYNTVDHAASNPAIRLTSYSGKVPQNVIVSGNLALGTHTTSGEFDVKVDASGHAVYSAITGNMLGSFYTNAKHVYVQANSFVGNAMIFLDNNADEIFIGPNTWSNGMDFYGAGNPGLSGDVYIAKQQWSKWYPPNFLPNYSSANPMWDATYHLDSDVRLVTFASFSTSSNTPVDVPGGVFVLSYPVILDKLIAIADCATHSGHLQVTDMSNNEVARIDFHVTPGAGGTNVVSSLFTFPQKAGNPYKPKLNAGVYKVRAYSDLNELTVKTISIATWG